MKHRGNMKTHLFSVVSVLLVVSLMVIPASAYDFAGVVVHVTTISPVNFPGNVEFQSDNTPSACNGVLYYFPVGADEATQQTNAKAVMAIVLSAQLTGRSVTIYGIYPTSTFQWCTVQWIFLNNS